MTRFKIFVVLLFIGGIYSLQAQSLSSKIETAVEQFTGDAQMQHAITSLTVLNAQTGVPIYTHNSQVGLATASTLKVITAATAYAKLGTEFRYKTKLLYSGDIRDGVLYGNIIIKGSGDPTLGSWRYASTKPKHILGQWVKAIKKAGIQNIQGRIIGDGTAFGSQLVPDGWIREDIGNYYGAGSSGLSWHENQYDLYLQPSTQKGESVSIDGTNPRVPQLHFVNELQTGSRYSGDQTYIYTGPYNHVAYLRGSAPAEHPNFSVSGAVPNPPLFAANQLEYALQEAGISVKKPASTVRLWQRENKTALGDFHLLAVHQSPKLPKICAQFLTHSINLYGESLVKTLAVQNGKKGTTANGVAVLVDYWKTRGMDKEALHVIDGSGLSPSNRVTTKAMATVLYHARQAPWFKKYYYNLPIIHNIRMKSGHIHGVAAYTGLLTAQNGTRLIFSFIVNNYSGETGALSAKIFRLLDSLKH